MEDIRDGRQIYCIVTDKYGNSVQSDTVTLSTEKYAKIIKQPISVIVAEGMEARIKLMATGDDLSYKWYFKNRTDSKFYYTSTFKSNTYSAQMDNTRNGRQIYCIVTDKYGNSVQSNTVTISMPLKITKHPESVGVPEGTIAKVSLTAEGEGLTYNWYFKNPNSNIFVYTSSFTSNTYYVKMDRSRDGRQVYCVVTDKYGASRTSYVVTLSMADISLEITKQPENVSAPEGYTAKVSVEASGVELSYKWYFKNPGADKFTYTSTFTSNTYSVKMDSTRNGRELYCVITDKYGRSVQSNTVTLSMTK